MQPSPAFAREALLTAFFLFLLTFSAFGFTGKLVKVIDGDTVEVMQGGRAERVRLHGIDAPEKGQPYGQAAKRFVLDVAAGKHVTVQVRDTDRYGRIVGEVILPSGESLNRLLVQEGYAWWYRRYSDDASLGQFEAEAREEGRRLWNEPNPVPPWEWRQGKRGAPSSERQVSVQFSGECGDKRYCREMTSCEEAMFHLRLCGRTRLDGDGDGVPCENICR